MTRLVQELFSRSASANPEAVAIVDRGTSISYGQLDAWTNRLARGIQEAGCRKGDRIGLLAPKSTAAIAAALAVYKAGAVLVPLDPASPAARVDRIVRSCGCRWIVAGGSALETMAQARFAESVSILWMGPREEAGKRLPAPLTFEDLESCSSAALTHRSAPEEAAHILYTSGSTGEPKGVVVTHASVVHFVEWALKRYGLGPGDRFSGHSPLHFDLSTFDLFGAFGAGASLHLVPAELNLDAHRLAQFIRESELTEWLSVPSALHFMAQHDAIREGDFPALRRLFWCGEIFPTPGLIHWMSRLPHVGFTNLYGPTETTIASSYYDVPRCPEDPRESIPIGTACEGEELLLLDRSLRPVPQGTLGEIYIRGAGLSPGYWNDPDKTRSAFVPAPGTSGALEALDKSHRMYRTGDLARRDAQGLLHVVGRADSQIKSRGYRIELGEVETALAAIGLCKEAAAVAIPTEGFESTLICCAFVPHDAGVNAAAIQRKLRDFLPFYMLPLRWMAMERLPRNGSGKVDRRWLKERFESNETHGAERRAAR
jgi:amino acid adenylation domain-containing protein